MRENTVINIFPSFCRKSPSLWLVYWYFKIKLTFSNYLSFTSTRITGVQLPFFTYLNFTILYSNFKAIHTLSNAKYQKCKLDTLYRIPSLLEPLTTTTMTTTTPETVTVSVRTESLIDDYGKVSNTPTTTVSTMTVLPTPPTLLMPPLEEAERILTFLQNKIQFLEEKKRWVN